MSRLERALEEALRRKAETGGATASPPASRDEAASEVAFEPETDGEGALFASVPTPDTPAPEAAVSDEASPKTALPPRQGAVSPFVILRRDDNPLVSEEYGKIKTGLLQLMEKSSQFRRLLVTSTLKQEGKTLTSINLACSLARSYQHDVLLVDADLRAPAVHRYLGLDLAPGFIQCLRGEVGVQEAARDIGVPHLKVLTAGAIAADPVEALSSAKTAQLFASYGGSASTILMFDAPPTLAFADSLSLLPLVGGVLFVVREGHAGKAQIHQAISSLGKENLVGIVYNGAEFNMKKSDGYYGAYGY